MYKIIGADGKEYGPVAAEQLRQWQTEGRVNAQTRILPDGATEWKALGELTEFTTPPGGRPTPQPIRPLTTQPVSYQPQRANGFALTGLILSIISLPISFCCCGGVVLNLLAIIFSIIGLTQINKRPDLYSGKGLAIAALIISGLILLTGLMFTILGFALNWDDIVRDLGKI